MASNDIDPCRGTLVLENEKFATNSLDKTVIRVADDDVLAAIEGLTIGGGSGGSGPLAGIVWDAHDYSVASNVETYRFFEGGLGGTLLKTATLTYEDDTLCVLVSSVWT